MIGIYLLPDFYCRGLFLLLVLLGHLETLGHVVKDAHSPEVYVLVVQYSFHVRVAFPVEEVQHSVAVDIVFFAQS